MVKWSLQISLVYCVAGSDETGLVTFRLSLEKKIQDKSSWIYLENS